MLSKSFCGNLLVVAMAAIPLDKLGNLAAAGIEPDAKKGLHIRISPICTFSQNGYGARIGSQNDDRSASELWSTEPHHAQ